jgi:hypothetical protein
VKGNGGYIGHGKNFVPFMKVAILIYRKIF